MKTLNTFVLFINVTQKAKELVKKEVQKTWELHEKRDLLLLR